MIYNCQQIRCDNANGLFFNTEIPLELIVQDKVLKASLVGIYSGDPIHSDIWQINESGSEPVLYEGLEFEMWSGKHSLGRFKVL